MSNATCKRLEAGRYEYKGYRITQTPSDVYGDNCWHIASVNGDPVEVATTLRSAKAMIDGMQPVAVRVELSVSGSQMYRHVSKHGELRRNSLDELMSLLRFIYGDCIAADVRIGDFCGDN
jgi:hypothetical protein